MKAAGKWVFGWPKLEGKSVPSEWLIRFDFAQSGVVAMVSASSTITFAQTPTNAPAQPKKKAPVVLRSASGTVIQPTRTIIHNPDGTTTVIVVPRRSYLDVGNEVPVGYPRTNDYAFPTGGDPGRPYGISGPIRRRRRLSTRPT